MVADESDIVRCARITKSSHACPGQHFCLADIRVIVRLQRAAAERIVVFVRWDVAFASFNFVLEKLQRAFPYGMQFLIRERRLTLSGPFQIGFICSVRIAEPLQYPAGEMGHRVVAAAFRDGTARVQRRFRRAFVIRFGVCQRFINGTLAFMPEYIRRLYVRAVQEPRCVQGFPIKERIPFHAGAFEGGIRLPVRAFRDGCNQMEPRPFRVFPLGQHVMPARRGGKGDICQVAFRECLRRHPFIRVVCLVIIAIPHNGVCCDEIVVGPVIIFIGGRYMVMRYSRSQVFRPADNCLVRVQAVRFVSCAVRCV